MTRRTSTIVTAAVAVLLSLGLSVAPVAQSAQPADVEVGRQVFEANCAMCHGTDASGMMGMHPSLRGAAGWMWLLPILLAVAIILAVVAIVRAGGGRQGEPGAASPREVLDRRYASGEIEREEYLRRREDLEG